MDSIKVCGKIQAWLKTNEALKELHVRDFFSYKKNLTPDQFLSDLCNACTGTSTNFEIKYIALSTAYDPPTKQTGLELELARVAPTGSISKLNKKLIVNGEFGNTVATQIKNISSVASTTVFTVNSATGLSVGDRIAVKTTSNTTFEERKITNISGNDITVHQAFTSLPVVGTGNCKQMISRLHLAYGASATSSLNTGSAISLAVLKTTKDSTQTLYTRHEIEFIST